MTIRIQSPEGVPGRPGASLARSPELLAGRRLAVLDNGKPGAALLLGVGLMGLVFVGRRPKRGPR